MSGLELDGASLTDYRTLRGAVTMHQSIITKSSEIGEKQALGRAAAWASPSMKVDPYLDAICRDLIPTGAVRLLVCQFCPCSQGDALAFEHLDDRPSPGKKQRHTT